MLDNLTLADLQIIWFILVGVLFSGYAVLDGFDLGTGTLQFFIKGDENRRLMLNAVGPVWDGNEVWLITGGGALFAAFPYVYASVFSGFYLAFMLLLLTLDYRFDRIDLPRYLLIFAATAGAILTRRWYLYFVVGYCFAYVLLLVVSSVRLAKSGQQSRAVRRLVRLAVFGLCAAGAMVLLLLPMVRKILGFDYAGRYSYYNFGGITLELAAQTLRIGLLNFILIGMGLWFAAKRRLPALPCLAGCLLYTSPRPRD